jgi:hypothetical protein
MADDKVKQEDAFKALVDNALSGNVHPDQRTTLEQWREENTTDEERESRLTDDERAELEAGRANEGGTEARPATPDESASGQDEDQTERQSPDHDAPGARTQPGGKGSARDAEGPDAAKADTPKSGTPKK